MLKTPHIIAIIKFFSSENGGRNSPLPLGRIGYIFVVGEFKFSCHLINSSNQTILPGDTAQLEIVLLDYEHARPFIQIGTEFILKDYRKVASGVVVDTLL